MPPHTVASSSQCGLEHWSPPSARAPPAPPPPVHLVHLRLSIYGCPFPPYTSHHTQARPPRPRTRNTLRGASSASSPTVTSSSPPPLRPMSTVGMHRSAVKQMPSSPKGRWCCTASPQSLASTSRPPSPSRATGNTRTRSTTSRTWHPSSSPRCVADQRRLDRSHTIWCSPSSSHAPLPLPPPTESPCAPTPWPFPHHIVLAKYHPPLYSPPRPQTRPRRWCGRSCAPRRTARSGRTRPSSSRCSSRRTILTVGSSSSSRSPLAPRHQGQDAG